MSQTLQTRTQNQDQNKKWKPDIYYRPDVAHSGVSELSFNYLLDHIKEAVKEAEILIRKGWPSLAETRKIMEEKVMEKLSQYQDIEFVEYYFDESAPWDAYMFNDVEISRTYDAIDWLTIAIADGPEILFDVYADYVVVEDKDEEHVAYFKINEIVLNSVRF
jgi:hypothetical protein